MFGALGIVANTIVSSGPQLAPAELPCVRPSDTGGPPVIDTFLSSPPMAPEKNPIQRPSGEKNGLLAPVMPPSGTASS